MSVERTPPPPAWFTEGQTNLRYFTGDEVDGMHTGQREARRLLPDETARKSARGFWKLAKPQILKHMRNAWQEKYGGQPVAVAGERGTTIVEADNTRTASLFLRHPLRWATVLGQTLGTWEPYTVEEWTRWAASSPSQLPPHVVMDVGRDSLIRMAAFALTNQVEHCIAVVDGKQFAAAQEWARLLEQRLAALIAKKADKYHEGSGGRQLYDAMCTWIRDRIKVIEFESLAVPEFLDVSNRLEAYDIKRVMAVRKDSMKKLIGHLMEQHAELFKRVNLFILNNTGDAAFHLSAVSSARTHWDQLVDPDNLEERTLQQLVRVDHLSQASKDLCALVQFEYPEWYSLDQNDLLSEVSSTPQTPWYAHIDAEAWLSAYGISVTDKQVGARSTWMMFLHAPTPHGAATSVTSNILSSGQTMRVPLTKLRIDLGLHLYAVVRDERACSYTIQAHNPKAKPEGDGKSVASQSAKVQLGQWLYFAKRVAQEVVDLAAVQEGTASLVKLPTTHWYMKELRYGASDGVPASKLPFESYTVTKFMKSHQRDVVLGQVALTPGDVHHTPRGKVLLASVKQWFDIAQVLDRSFKLSASGNVEFIAFLASASSGSGGSDALLLSGANLLSGTNDAQALWLMANARNFAYASLMVPARAAHAHIDSDGTARKHLMQHIMVTPDLLQAQLLHTQAQHMCPDEYWDFEQPPTKQDRRFVLPMASLAIHPSEHLHRAIVLHQDLYGASATMYDASVATDVAKTAQQKALIAENLKKHMEFCLNVKQKAGEEKSPLDTVVQVPSIRLMMLDLVDVVGAPNIFYEACLKALEDVMPRALEHSNAKYTAGGKAAVGSYQHEVLLVVLGLEPGYKNVSGNAVSEYRLSKEICAAFSVDYKNVEGLRIFKYSKWKARALPKTPVVAVLEKAVTSQSPLVAASTPVAETPTTPVSVSAAPPPETTAVVVLPELTTPTSVSAKKVLESITPKPTASTTKAAQKKQKSIADRIDRAQKQAQVARDHIESLRRACELRMKAVPKDAREDDEYMKFMRAGITRTKKLLKRWEKLTNDEEKKLVQRLRDTAGSGASASDASAAITSAVQSAELLEVPILEAQNTARHETQQLLTDAMEVVANSNPPGTPSTPMTVAALTPQRRRSPLFISPPVYKSPSAVVVVGDAEATSETTGAELVEWFVVAAVGDLSGYLLLWYAALDLDLSRLLNKIDAKVSKVRAKWLETKSQRHKDKKEELEAMRTKVNGYARTVTIKCRTLEANEVEAAKAREKLRTIPMSQMSFNNSFLREVFVALQHVVDASGVAQRVPTEDELKSVTALLSSKYGELRDATRNSAKSISALADKKQQETFVKLIKDVNVALGLTEDGAPSSVTTKAMIMPKYARNWCENTYDVAENAIVVGTDRSPMEPTSTAMACQHVAEVFAMVMETQFKPRSSSYAHRLKLGVAAIFVTLRLVVLVFLDWIDTSLARKNVADAVAVAQGVPTLCSTQRELVQWLGMQQVQYFFSQNAMQLNDYLMKRKWSWDEEQTDEEFLMAPGGDDDAELLPTKLSKARRRVRDEDATSSSDDEERDLGEESEEEEDEEGSDEDESDLIDAPNIANYLELEEFHRRVWTTDYKQWQADPTNKNWTKKWSDKLVQALVVTLNTEEESDDLEEPTSSYEDDDEMDDEDRAFIVDDGEDESEDDRPRARQVSVRRRIEFDDPDVKEVDEQFPIYPFNNPEALQMRAESSAEAKEIYVKAVGELPNDVYNFMHDAFAPAATDAQPHRYVFRLRDGFEHLTLQLWKLFGTTYLKHRKLGRAHEVNNTTTMEDPVTKKLMGINTYIPDNFMDARFLKAIQTEASKKHLMSSGKYAALLRTHNEALERDRKTITREQEVQLRAQLAATNIVKQALTIAWSHSSDTVASADGSRNATITAIEESKKVLGETSGETLANLFESTMQNSAMYKRLRTILLHSAVKLFAMQPLWSDLHQTMVQHGLLQEPSKMRDASHAILSFLPRDVDNEYGAGPLSRFYQYFNATSSEARALPVNFWKLAINQAVFDETINEVNGDGVNALPNTEALLQERMFRDVMHAINDAFDDNLARMTPEFAALPEVVELGNALRTTTDTALHRIVHTTMQKRVQVMVHELITGAMREFIVQATLAYSCSRHTADTVRDHTTSGVVRELQAAFPRASLVDVQWGNPEPAVKVAQNKYVRLPDSAVQVRMQERQARDRLLNGVHLDCVMQLLVLSNKYLALSQRSIAMSSEARMMLGALSDEESVQQESPVWASVTALACLRTVRWAASETVPSSEQQRQSRTSKFHWLHMYDVPRVIESQKSNILWEDVTETDLLYILHRIVSWSWSGAIDVHFYDAFNLWHRPQTSAYGLSRACRALLDSKLQRGEKEYDDSVDSRVLGVFALAFPRHCNTTADGADTLEKRVSGARNREVAQTAEDFVGVSWRDTYHMLKEMYDRASQALLASDAQTIAKSIAVASDATPLENLEQSGARAERVRKYLKNYSDKMRFSGGALYVDERTGKALAYRPMLPKKNNQGDLKYYERPIDDLEAFFASAQVSAESAPQLPTPSVVAPPKPTTATILQPKRKIAPTAVVATPTVIVGKRKQPPSPTSPPTAGAAASKSVRIEESNVGAGTPSLSMLPTIDSTGTIDVPTELQNSLDRVDSQQVDPVQPVASSIAQACMETETVVRHDIQLLTAFNERKLPARQQSPASKAVINNQPIAQMVMMSDPVTPEKLIRDVVASPAFSKMRFETQASKSYQMLLDYIAGSKYSDDAKDNIITAVDDLHARYAQDDYRLLSCVATNCEDMLWPQLDPQDRTAKIFIKNRARTLVLELNEIKP